MFLEFILTQSSLLTVLRDYMVTRNEPWLVSCKASSLLLKHPHDDENIKKQIELTSLEKYLQKLKCVDP